MLFSFAHHGHIGFDFKLPNGGSFIEAGGNYGFIDIQKNEQTERNRAGAPIISSGISSDLVHIGKTGSID
jgi:hypothetical protein